MKNRFGQTMKNTVKMNFGILMEMCIRDSPRCRGAFVGLNIIHTKAHLLRAIMEGVAYSLADCNNILKNLGIAVDNMKVCGGGSRSPVWRRIMAALYGCNIIRLEQEEGPAYGAAILAGVGTGVYDDVRDVSKKLARCGRVTVPDEEEAAVYRRYHDLYDRCLLYTSRCV